MSVVNDLGVDDLRTPTFKVPAKPKPKPKPPTNDITVLNEFIGALRKETPETKFRFLTIMVDTTARGSSSSEWASKVKEFAEELKAEGVVAADTQVTIISPIQIYHRMIYVSYAMLWYGTKYRT